MPVGDTRGLPPARRTLTAAGGLCRPLPPLLLVGALAQCVPGVRPESWAQGRRPQHGTPLPSILWSAPGSSLWMGWGRWIYRRGDENTLASYFQNTLPVPKEFYRALRVSREKTGGAVPPSLTSIPAAAAGTLPTGGGELWCDGSEVIHLSMPGGAFTDAALTATLRPGRRTLTRATGLALITVRLPDPHLDHARLAGLPCGLHEGK